MTVRLCASPRPHGAGLCKREAGWGTDHQGWGRCRWHGGSSPNGKLFAAREEAEFASRVMGVPVPTSITEALQMCVDRAAARVRYCDRRLAELTDDDAAGPVVTRVDRSGGEGGGYSETREGPPAAHIWVALHGQAIDQLARVTKLAADANVNERQTQVLEQNANVLGQVFVAVFEELGLTREQRQVAAAAVEHHLQLVEGTAVPA